jgi:predicted nucleic acid-binding protein
MAVLVDTNVLLRGLQPYHPSSSVAGSAIDALRRTGETMIVASQNIIEFWVVATTPLRDNGFGLSPEKAAREIAGIKALFGVLPESTQILPEGERLVCLHRVSGKNAHDARLIAVMNVNRIDRILTFNGTDFERFDDIGVLDPQLVA